MSTFLQDTLPYNVTWVDLNLWEGFPSLSSIFAPTIQPYGKWNFLCLLVHFQAYCEYRVKKGGKLSWTPCLLYQLFHGVHRVPYTYNILYLSTIRVNLLDGHLKTHRNLGTSVKLAWETLMLKLVIDNQSNNEQNLSKVFWEAWTDI